MTLNNNRKIYRFFKPFVAIILAMVILFGTASSGNAAFVNAASSKTKEKPNAAAYKVYAVKMKELYSVFKMAKKNKLTEADTKKEFRGFLKLQSFMYGFDSDAISEYSLVYSVTDLNKDNVPELVVGVRKTNNFFMALSVYTFKKKVKDTGIHPTNEISENDNTGIRICENGIILYEKFHFKGYERLVYDGGRILGISSLESDEISVYKLAKKKNKKLVLRMNSNYEYIKNNSNYESYRYETAKNGKDFQEASAETFEKYQNKYCKDAKLKYYEYTKKAYKALKSGKKNYKGQKSWKYKTRKVSKP